MTLNSEGLEKAADALAKIYHGEGDEPFHLMATTAISAYLSALPPVDGLEVVAWKVSATDRLDQFFEIEGEADQWANSPGVFDSVVSGLVTLSQASSVIAGLRSERITAERDALDSYGKLQTAEARLSSLEEENKRLREALEKVAQEQIQTNFGPWPTKGSEIARQALGDHNG